MKKSAKRLFVLVLAFMVVGAVFASDKDTVVYITKSGKKYHTASCSSLSKSKIQTSLGSAVSRGYGPCSRCNPPVLN
jgi:methylphosphotriester-DNA--protein-cysteine methyltransferase